MELWGQTMLQLSPAVPHSFEGLLGRKPSWKMHQSLPECFLGAANKTQKILKRHLAQHKNRGEDPPLTISPPHSSPHLPNNKIRLVPGASSLMWLEEIRLGKIYNGYKI